MMEITSLLLTPLLQDPLNQGSQLKGEAIDLGVGPFL